MPKRMTHEQFVSKVEEKNIQKFEFLSLYTSSNHPIKVKNLECNHIYEVPKARNLIEGKTGGRCPICYPDDLSGKQFGKLTVIKEAGYKGKYKTWLCKCECGNEKIIRHSDLLRREGGTKSCGCLVHSDRTESLLNKVFGDLTVIKELPKKHNRKIWLCQCKCGNYREVKNHDLINGSVKSCATCTKEKITLENDKKELIGKKFGMLTIKEIIRKRGEKPIAICICDCGNSCERILYNLKNANYEQSCGCLNRKDLTGMKFGKLTVIKEIDCIKKRYANSDKIHTLRRWLCKCECGKMKKVLQTYLERGNVKSCGCLLSTEELSKRMLGKNNPMYGKIGELSPRWNPNLSKEEREIQRRTRENYIWRMNVLKRDGFQCKCCGVLGNGYNLNVHHIYNYKDYPELRYEETNGITLCVDCHTNFHIIYGKEKNNKEQLEEFLKLNSKNKVDLEEILNKPITNKLTAKFKPYIVTIKEGKSIYKKEYFTAKEAAKDLNISYSNFVTKKRISYKKIIAQKNDTKLYFNSYEEAKRFFNCSSYAIKNAIKNNKKIDEYSLKEVNVELILNKKCIA
jgi:5-methylcytosine-specific restriction endonuclease McrA